MAPFSENQVKILTEVYSSYGIDFTKGWPWISVWGEIIDIEHPNGKFKNMLYRGEILSDNKQGCRMLARELIGFYSNNGWTVVNNESDVPKNGTIINYIMRSHPAHIEKEYKYSKKDLSKANFVKEISHWRLSELIELPLY